MLLIMNRLDFVTTRSDLMFFDAFRSVTGGSHSDSRVGDERTAGKAVTSLL